MLLASDWSWLLTAIVPFVLLGVFWAFLSRSLRKTEDPQQQLVEKLDEIREELVRLRKSIESRP